MTFFACLVTRKKLGPVKIFSGFSAVWHDPGLALEPLVGSRNGAAGGGQENDPGHLDPTATSDSLQSPHHFFEDRHG